MKLAALVPILGVLAVLAAAWTLRALPSEAPGRDPWAGVPARFGQTDHSLLFEGLALTDGPAVTRACLACHEDAAHELMRTSHWLWLGPEETPPGRSEPIRIGKRNVLNNFCISIEGNWRTCTACHAGYGWTTADFDFTDPYRVDCLICHDRSGTYIKANGGLPAEDVDLLVAAKSVGRTSRDNCGACHFSGGGGDAVKHGDLDLSLARPSERVDVHMGRHDFVCTDCHVTEGHAIPGKLLSVNTQHTLGAGCARCHGEEPHGNARLDAHVASIACQTCHIPEVARTQATKIAWDWSTAGREGYEDDPHRYLKIKGSFVYARNLVPEYAWYNGQSRRYLNGDAIDPNEVTPISAPLGDIDDARAKIWPFKIHRAKQPYDVAHGRLIVLRTSGPDGFWEHFDWEKAARLGGESSGMEFSGQLGFAETEMHWPLNHMVAPKERALQCTDCHSEDGRGGHGRLDWQRLGYAGDPAFVTGRRHRRAKEAEEAR